MDVKGIYGIPRELKGHNPPFRRESTLRHARILASTSALIWGYASYWALTAEGLPWFGVTCLVACLAATLPYQMLFYGRPFWTDERAPARLRPGEKWSIWVELRLAKILRDLNSPFNGGCNGAHRRRQARIALRKHRPTNCPGARRYFVRWEVHMVHHIALCSEEAAGILRREILETPAPYRYILEVLACLKPGRSYSEAYESLAPIPWAELTELELRFAYAHLVWPSYRVLGHCHPALEPLRLLHSQLEHPPEVNDEEMRVRLEARRQQSV